MLNIVPVFVLVLVLVVVLLDVEDDGSRNDDNDVKLSYILSK